MKLEVINGQRVLTPESGFHIYNETDKVISDKVYLGINADEKTWTDITKEEKRMLESQWESFEEVTEQDYQDALAEMGVNLNG